MGLMGFIKKQFIDVIQWTDPQEDVLVWRFPMQDQEIQTGAQLTVREAQMALIVDEGKAADAFGPGLHKLTTRNLPLLTNLKHWDKLFESPFKTDVYFFNTKLQLGRKWGTAQPITIRDKEFGIVSVRAFGMYSYKIANPTLFFKEVSGVCSQYTGHAMEEQARNLIITSLSALFGNSNIPFIDMAANQVELSKQMADTMKPAFESFGLELENFAVESITLPENLQKRLDERISMGIIGDMNRYTQYQTASSIPLAAQNEGGIAGIGAGMAAGMGMGQMMANAMTGSMSAGMNPNQGTAPQQPVEAQPATPTAPAVPPQASAEDRLAKLKSMLDKGLITQRDYDATKAEILKQLIG